MIEPQMGTEVKDKNGKSLGTIDYIVRDTWSGDIRKFMIYREAPEADLSFSLEDVSEVKEDVVELAIEVS